MIFFKRVIAMGVLFSSVAFIQAAEERPVISGVIIDSQNQMPLEGANVFIAGTDLGSSTNETGEYTIQLPAPGKFTLQAQYIGYELFRKEINVENNREVNLSISLEPSAIGMERVVVSATKSEKYQRDAPVIVNVLDKKSFENTQSINLFEGLTFQPGVRVETLCQNCGFSGVRINGLESAYTQILIDSKPVYSSLNSVYGLEHIPASMLDRVEITKGGGSALFGGNAIAGTVNIITKEPTSSSFEISSNTAAIDGNELDQTINLNASIISENRDLGMSLFSLYRNRDPYDASNDDFSEITKLSNNSFGMRGFYRPSELSKFSGELHVIKEERRGGNRFEYQPHEADIAEFLDHEIIGGGLSYERYSENLANSFKTYLSFQSTIRESYYGAGRDPNAYGNTDNLIAVGGLQFAKNVDKLLIGRSEISFGLESQIDNIDDFQPGYYRRIKQNIRQLGGYLQSNWQFHKTVTFLAGLRLEKHNQIDPLILNPRMNLLFQLTDDMQFRTSYARGFRAPSAFDEDLHIENVGSQKFSLIELDDDLKEERSHTINASFDYSKRAERYLTGFTIEGFYTRLEDAFVNEEISATDDLIIFEKRNGAGTTIRGVNIDARLATKNLAFDGGFTLQTSKHAQPVEWASEQFSDKILRNPSLYGTYQITWEPEVFWTIILSGVYTGAMEVPHLLGYIDEPVLEETAPFMETNLKLSYLFWGKKSISSGLEISIGVQNIFNSYQSDFDNGINRDSAYVYGPNRPRTFFVGTRFEM